MKSAIVRSGFSATAQRGGTARRQVKTHFRREKEPRRGNVEGQFFVDDTCIDCDTCRWMAPDTFSRVGGGSAVVKQPETREQRVKAMQATLSCPTCVSSSYRTCFPLVTLG